MKNLAQELKRKRDAEARLRQTDPNKGIIYSGDGSTGAGGGGYVVPADLLNETAHDALDHTGLTGVPSIAGLLDETAHDALDHTGLTGVATDFLDLTDTPAAYTGAGSKVVAVKADVSGLEFVAAPAAENGVPEGGTENQLAAKNSADDYDIKWMDAPAAANGLPAGGTAGQILAKVDADDYDAAWVTPPGVTPTCRVYNNANQSIANSTWTPLAFNTERFDTDTMHDVTTNNSRLTCKTAGKYLMIGHIQFTHNGSGIREVAILLNGTDYIALQTYTPISNGRMQISTIYDLAANDYVQLCVNQSSGGALNVEYVSGYMFTPEFMAARVG